MPKIPDTLEAVKISDRFSQNPSIVKFKRCCNAPNVKPSVAFLAFSKVNPSTGYAPSANPSKQVAAEVKL